MRGFVALAALILPGAAFSAVVWIPSPTTPEAFARRSDLAMKNATGMSAQTLGRAEFLDKKLHKAVATHNGRVFYRSPKVFHVEYPRATVANFYEDWMTYTEVGDGKTFGRQRRGGWKDASPVAARPPLGGSVLETWPILGPGRVLGSVGTNHMPISKLIQEARAAKLKIKVERSQGAPRALERLTIERVGDKTKKIKPFTLEIIADPNQGFPLSMFNISFDSRNKSIAMRWAARWNVSPGQTFPPEFFVIGK